MLYCDSYSWDTKKNIANILMSKYKPNMQVLKQSNYLLNTLL